jgi:hypothetical protein
MRFFFNYHYQAFVELPGSLIILRITATLEASKRGQTTEKAFENWEYLGPSLNKFYLKLTVLKLDQSLFSTFIFETTA